MTYANYQKHVYESLMKRHQREPEFRFSVRQVASKNSECNYFIGTEKSNYFGFTFWDIPVSYPGSSADLTNFIFFQDEGKFGFHFQLITTRFPDNTQNQVDLDFCRKAVDEMKRANLSMQLSLPEHKIFFARTPTENIRYPDIEQLLVAFHELYDSISPCLDNVMFSLKQEQPHWKAERFTASRFEELQQKMQNRITRYTQAQHTLLPEQEETLVVVNDTDDVDPTKIMHPLNTILYGPPGTGKTYNSINHALSIIEGKPLESYEQENRDKVKERFDALLMKGEQGEGQIGFITFHQSLSYEDFVEGIKPVAPEDTDAFLKYEVQPGILKRIAELARYKPDAQTERFSIPEADFGGAMFYKMSLGRANNEEDEAIYRWCMDNGYIALGWGDDIDFSNKSEVEIRPLTKENGLDDFHGDAIKRFVHWIHDGDYVLISEGNRICRAIGRVISDYEFKADSPIPYHQFRKVEWLLKDVSIPVEEIYGRAFSMMSIYQLDKGDLKKIFS